MAPEVEAGDAPADPSSSTTTTANTRARRRVRKRNGPPQFQFLTATDPSQFKDENAKRSVRSQAMIQYRYKAEQQKRKTKDTTETIAARPVEKAPIAERITPIVTNDHPSEGAPDDLLAHILQGYQEDQHIYPSTSAAWWATYQDEGFAEPSGFPAQPEDLPPAQPSRYYRALSLISSNVYRNGVTEYEDSDYYEELQMRMLVAKLATLKAIGDGVDPFRVIPQFANPELDSLFLVRKCNRAFVTPNVIKKWLPALLSHPHLLLSGVLLASTWLDMHAGCSGDSKRTALIKNETLGWINERLRNSATQFEDSTLMVILHLLAGEMWNCNEKTLRIHQSGIARLITHRGGMSSLGGYGTVAEIAVGCCQHTDIICEADPLPIFHQWSPPEFVCSDDTTAIPESPLFCPRDEFFTIAQDPRCSETTYNLLCDVRDLTDLFLMHNERLDTVRNVEAEDDSASQSLSLLDYSSKLDEIRARVASLPSANTPGLPTYNDWVYESCRIASIIYVTAIILRIPFSVAAEPGRFAVLANPPSLTNDPSGCHLMSIRLTEALYEAVEKSNIENLWGDMSGVFYWVTAIGAAAGRTPSSVNIPQIARSRSEGYATWVRRCMIMFATKAMIILIFQHPVPLIMTQKRLLKVMSLIGSTSSRRLS